MQLKFSEFPTVVSSGHSCTRSRLGGHPATTPTAADRSVKSCECPEGIIVQQQLNRLHRRTEGSHLLWGSPPARLVSGQDCVT